MPGKEGPSSPLPRGWGSLLSAIHSHHPPSTETSPRLGQSLTDRSHGASIKGLPTPSLQNRVGTRGRAGPPKAPRAKAETRGSQQEGVQGARTPPPLSPKTAPGRTPPRTPKGTRAGSAAGR